LQLCPIVVNFSHTVEKYDDIALALGSLRELIVIRMASSYRSLTRSRRTAHGTGGDNVWAPITRTLFEFLLVLRDPLRSSLCKHEVLEIDTNSALEFKALVLTLMNCRALGRHRRRSRALAVLVL
jgi:hypothetical protein